MPSDGIRHGTYYGFQQHMKRKIPSCEECRAANRIYQRGYRLRSEKARRRDQKTNLSRHRALQRLAEAHREEFTALLLEEKRRLGL